MRLGRLRGARARRRAAVAARRDHGAEHVGGDAVVREHAPERRKPAAREEVLVARNAQARVPLVEQDRPVVVDPSPQAERARRVRLRVPLQQRQEHVAAVAHDVNEPGIGP